ncbi:hypothetical protein C3454_19690 [Citrobacter europaeus]|nr:hypothetical protein CU079_08755 [Citrobacter freundii]ROW34525.1 hypothetical protein C3454_19690 [Citrobacter europaeus]
MTRIACDSHPLNRGSRTTSQRYFFTFCLYSAGWRYAYPAYKWVLLIGRISVAPPGISRSCVTASD